MKHLTKEGLDFICEKINLSTTKLGGLSDDDVIYKRAIIVNGSTTTLLGSSQGEGFSIYAPTNHGGANGLILTSKMMATPVWTTPSSITVGKATQLANTRKIWGQNFNGTGNVDGDLTANGNINATGGVSAKGIADLTNNLQKAWQTVVITSTGASSYTFAHQLASTDVLVMGVTVSGGNVYGNENVFVGNTIPQSTATTIGNFIRYTINSATSITLKFRSSTYAPTSGQTIKVTIIKANL